MVIGDPADVLIALNAEVDGRLTSVAADNGNRSAIPVGTAPLEDAYRCGIWASKRAANLLYLQLDICVCNGTDTDIGRGSKNSERIVTHADSRSDIGLDGLLSSEGLR